MEKTQYYLIKKIAEADGCQIFSGHSGDKDQPLTMIQYKSTESGDCAEVKAFRELQRVKNDHSLPIIEIISEDGIDLIVTPQFRGLDAATWFKANGKIDEETTLRFAKAILEWAVAWNSAHDTWPWLQPEHVWVTREESGDLDLKIGTVISPVPEKAALDSVRNVLGLLLEEEGNWAQLAEGTLATFFSTISEGGPGTIESALDMLDSEEPTVVKPGGGVVPFRGIRIPRRERKSPVRAREASFHPSEMALSS